VEVYTTHTGNYYRGGVLLKAHSDNEWRTYQRGYEAALEDIQEEEIKSQQRAVTHVASDFLYSKAHEQAEKIDEQFGEDAYGGTNSLATGGRPTTTSAGTPINYNFDLGSVDLIDTPDSSCFSEIGYDERNEVLVVVFRDSGAMYAYKDVPDSVWDDLFFASSMGGYYNENIKGQYDCEKIVE